MAGRSHDRFGDDRIKGTHRFGETAIFAPTSFNVAAFSLGAGDIVYLDGFTVMKISKK